MTSEPKPSPRRIIPNTFQTPNMLTDEAMRLLSGNEVKCYLVIVRKTFGWGKDSDRIARSQIMDITGLGETAVDASMSALVKFGLVLRVAENNPKNNIGVEWSLQLEDRRINWKSMQKRAQSTRSAKAESAAIARRSRGGVDGQPYLDGQGGGGVDGQGTQKPLSKTNKEEGYAPAKSRVFKVYEQEIGALTPIIADALKDAEETFPEEWVIEAIIIAVERNARNWKYVRAVLDDAKAKGMSPKLNNAKKTGSKPKGKRADGNDPIDNVLGE